MNISQIVEAFRQRGSWSKTKEIFQICDLPTGRGWDGTIKKLLEEKENDDKQLFTKINLLNKLYNNFLLIDNKAVRLYSIKRETIDAWINVFKSYQIENNLFKEAYPYPIKTEQLEQVNLLPHIVKIVDTEENICVVFCTKRTSVEREEIKFSKLEADLRKKYNKVVGVKEVYRQYFDFVLLYKQENRVEMRIDMTTGSSSSKDLPSKEIDQAFYEIINSFNKTVKRVIKTNEVLVQSTNVFQIIDRLYYSDEGKVVELDFATDEGSIKHAKMRKNSVDLRKELFHAGGIDNVSHINSYRLLISWNYQLPSNSKNTLELLLPGSVKELSNQYSYLGHFYVKNCICIQEYNFIIDKVLSYLRKS